MLTRVLVAASVAEPDIVTGTGSNEGWCFVGIVANKCISAIKESVLKEYRGLGCGSLLSHNTWDAHHRQNITVISGHLMSFNFKVIFLTKLDKSEITVRVGTGLHSSGK